MPRAAQNYWVYVNCMDIEFDPDKRGLTLQERGLDFADAGELFQGPNATRQGTRNDYGEPRFQTMGFCMEEPSWWSGPHAVKHAASSA